MARKRNPMARDLLTNPLYRPKHTKTRVERALKADRWNRRAKHKASIRSPEPSHGSGDCRLSPAAAAPSPARPQSAGR
jgi:hypothetical protein